MLAVAGLLISAPLFLLLIIILFLDNRGSVFFYQMRPGKNAGLFKLLKFKSMKDAFDETGKLLPDNQRLTRMGKLIRSTSLDELPQLINVLSGNMSFIGPRPLLVKYLPLYSPYQARRHEVRPGITGWAQVNGRNAISWQEKFELDVWYVDHMSFWLDMKIFFLTIKKVLHREGINAANEATMKPFLGNE